MNHRFDIDKTRWMELHDGLFIYVRAYGRRRLDIIVAPQAATGRGPLSEEPILATLAERVEVALLLVLGFGLIGLVVQSIVWFHQGFSFPWVVLLTSLVAGTVIWRMLRKGSRFVTRGTRIYRDVDAESAEFFAKDTRVNPELETLLAQLPEKTPTVRLARCRLWSPFGLVMRAALFPLSLLAMLVFSWLIFSTERSLFGGVFVVAIWMIPLACQAAHAVTLPGDLRGAYAALLQGDCAAASRVLDRILDASPNHWYANYCHAALSLLQGDFEQAARSVSAMQRSRFSTFLTPMFGGHQVDLPPEWVLDSMAKAMGQQQSGSIDSEGAAQMHANTPRDYEQPAH